MLKNKQVIDALACFRSVGTFTIPELRAILNCSSRTIQRLLEQWRCIRSYNQNGRYFTLPDIPVFDSNGIWSSNGASFSKAGSLRETVVSLVCSSPAGLSASDLGHVLSLNPHSFLSHFSSDPRLVREKWCGRLVYFAASEQARLDQRRKRLADEETSPMPSDGLAIIILVGLIKNPGASSEELAKLISQEHSGVDWQMIDRLLDHHGLKKKLPHQQNPA